ncbi:hypothetical protein AB0I84_36985 [Streptomyces spectabilis]|uniref:hypothetical protein n=1 Tax=Streptomyces spectabilis TaxID=68270 RepID=UPI00340EF04F
MSIKETVAGCGCLAFVGIVLVAAVASCGASTDDKEDKANPSATASPTTPPKKTESPQPSASEKTSGADATTTSPEPVETFDELKEFRSEVNALGSPAQKDAAQHVTKIQSSGHDRFEIWTDWKGGISSPNHGQCTILVSAWKDIETAAYTGMGYVGVYGSDGQLICNGAYT